MEPRGTVKIASPRALGSSHCPIHITLHPVPFASPQASSHPQSSPVIPSHPQSSPVIPSHPQSSNPPPSNLVKLEEVLSLPLFWCWFPVSQIKAGCLGGFLMDETSTEISTIRISGEVWELNLHLTVCSLQSAVC